MIFPFGFQWWDSSQLTLEEFGFHHLNPHAGKEAGQMILCWHLPRLWYNGDGWRWSARRDERKKYPNCSMCVEKPDAYMKDMKDEQSGYS
ncbi:hypothetical protein DV515_00002089 [Chloebia gouldiae]|uniref:Uncharacterized protein n=1 Tax=Chloebia gouldiae TaxID=44316 RepID=A0A3L8SWW9_CHLGU|nr:hypothetical protein DV515_00002089 [Chloebia gouldiae]